MIAYSSAVTAEQRPDLTRSDGASRSELPVDPGRDVEEDWLLDPTRLVSGTCNVIDPEIWPKSARRVGGILYLAGVSVTDLAAEYGTPSLFLDEEDLRGRARKYAAAFDDGCVFYAGKAFLSTAVARWVAEESLGVDVCTHGELVVALNAQVPAHRIALHGNNKSRHELERAVEAGVGQIMLDSLTEIDRLVDVCTAARVTQPVLIRVTVGVEAQTHAYIATAHEDQKFGFSVADGTALRAAAMVLAAPSLELRGLHSHIGSQIFDTDGFEIAAHRVVTLLAAIRDVHGVELPEINLGGGWGIAYVAGDDPQAPTLLADRLHSIVAHACDEHGIAVPSVCVEPGRAIVGPSAITVYEVGTVKDLTLDPGLDRCYVSVDGGMSDNIRTALYDARYTCTLANRESAVAPKLARVVGKHCESGDVIVRDTWLPGDVTAGDLLAVAATGAYCRSMASNYNHVPRPPVVGVRSGRSQVLVRRETEADLMRLDTGWNGRY